VTDVQFARAQRPSYRDANGNRLVHVEAALSQTVRRGAGQRLRVRLLRSRASTLIQVRRAHVPGLLSPAPPQGLATPEPYFSHAFEKRCLQLLSSRNSVDVRSAEDAGLPRTSAHDGRSRRRGWPPSGQNEIGDCRQYTETDKCTVSITTAIGDCVRVEIRLHSRSGSCKASDGC